MKARIYTKEYLEPLVKESVNICDLMRKIGISPRGGGHALLRKRIELYGIDSSHFKKNFFNRRRSPLYHTKESFIKAVLILGSGWNSHNIKNSLIKYGIIENKCCICGLTEWNGKPISLHLDHINGKHEDNRMENLRIVCLNCHSQTETYAGKHRRQSMGS